MAFADAFFGLGVVTLLLTPFVLLAPAGESARRSSRRRARVSR